MKIDEWMLHVSVLCLFAHAFTYSSSWRWIWHSIDTTVGVYLSPKMIVIFHQKILNIFCATYFQHINLWMGFIFISIFFYALNPKSVNLALFIHLLSKSFIRLVRTKQKKKKTQKFKLLSLHRQQHLPIDQIITMFTSFT